MNSDIRESLGRFVERSGSEMNDIANQLIELLEADEVEPIGAPGEPVLAEELADKLESKMAKLRRRDDDEPEGLIVIEDAVASLRANDGARVAPWTFEDGDGVRWFVLADEDDDVIACFTTAPFIEADS
jgi:hypothetical protein